MITEQVVAKLEKKIPSDCQGEERRAAYCVIIGCRDGKTLNEISRYYSIDMDLVNYWLDFLDIRNINPVVKTKRSPKAQKIQGYLSANVGKIITPKELADEIIFRQMLERLLRQKNWLMKLECLYQHFIISIMRTDLISRKSREANSRFLIPKRKEISKLNNDHYCCRSRTRLLCSWY